MMTIMITSIKEYCQKRKEYIKDQIGKNQLKISLAAIQVGDNEASTRYLRNKKKDCEEVGIEFHWYYYGDDISEKELIQEIVDLQSEYTGIIVQLPLPEGINVKTIQQCIDPNKDIDGFNKLSKFNPCTPKGIVDYLRQGRGWEPQGQNVVIIGRSDIVGKPLARMMTDLDATVTLCHSKTQGLWDHIQNADLIVCAVGKPQFLNCYAIHVPVVDVGFNFDSSGKVCGDCFNIEGRDVTPVPGGVGLLTRLALLENLCQAAGVEL